MDSEQTPIDQPVAQEPELIVDDHQIITEDIVSDIQPTPKKSKKLLIIIIAFILMVSIGAVTALILYLPDKVTEINLDDTKATADGKQYLVDANNEFAFDLYKDIIKTEESNIFYSPYSISSALAMVYAGAKGDTASEIKSTFHFPSVDALKSNIASIYNDVNEENDNYELKTGNALWIEKSISLLPDYISTIDDYFDGKLSNLDFKYNKEASRLTINKYISNQTNNKINDLLSSGDVDSLTKLILTNAIYFKGDWKKEFDSELTIKDNFHVTPIQSINTDMMRQFDVDDLNYVDTGNAQILELPYKGDKLSMLIILPKDDLNSISSLLTYDKINSEKSKMTKPDIESVIIPKFTFNTRYTLNDNLKSLGVVDAFSTNADFTGIINKDDADLFISSVIHQAFIDVNEQGTEAAAATAVVMMDATTAIGNSKPVINFIADHPFVFVIQDNESGNILFMGKVANPES